MCRVFLGIAIVPKYWRRHPNDLGYPPPEPLRARELALAAVAERDEEEGEAVESREQDQVVQQAGRVRMVVRVRGLGQLASLVLL